MSVRIETFNLVSSSANENLQLQLISVSLRLSPSLKNTENSRPQQCNSRPYSYQNITQQYTRAEAIKQKHSR